MEWEHAGSLLTVETLCLKLKHVQTSRRGRGDGPRHPRPEVISAPWPGDGAGSPGQRSAGRLAHVGTRKHRPKASSLQIADCSHSVAYMYTKAEPSEENLCNLRELLGSSLRRSRERSSSLLSRC